MYCLVSKNPNNEIRGLEIPDCFHIYYFLFPLTGDEIRREFAALVNPRIFLLIYIFLIDPLKPRLLI